jgi:hypothetical protein
MSEVESKRSVNLELDETRRDDGILHIHLEGVWRKRRIGYNDTTGAEGQGSGDQFALFAQAAIGELNGSHGGGASEYLRDSSIKNSPPIQDGSKRQ